MRFGIGFSLLALVSTARSADVNSAAASKQGVQITQLADRLHVEINGQLFTEYIFKDVPRPYCYPLMGPGEVAMTRNWPMKNTPNEEHDHPHHRSLWFAHGSVNGHDFWSEQKAFGKTVHEDFLEVKSGKEAGVIRFFNPGSASERVMDFDITLNASNGELTFGDTKEGTMAVRLAETMRLKGKVGHGRIVNSAGVRDDQTWGKRADWCDYSGPVDGKTVGIAIFDHPQNPRHPTWWHVRDYGLFAANPFGQHDFESLPDKTAGNLVVPAGKSVTFRYRLYLHEGDDQQAKVAEKYQQYVK